MKKAFLSLLICALIIPTYARGEHFYCEADLLVIEDSESSETKKILFNIDKTPENNFLEGVLITTSCYNQITEMFTSEGVFFDLPNSGQLAQGVLKDDSLMIGKDSYKLDLNFVLDPERASETNTSYFLLNGKLKPLNDESFIHQNVSGKCILKKD